MARANPDLIAALAETAERLALGAPYRWAHMGRCNCGHLAQTVTALSQAEIHAMALEKAGDWSRQALAYCPTSRFPMDHIIATLLDLGLDRQDLVHLEHLSDPRILARLPRGLRYLKRNRRDDVVIYLRAWQALLTDALPQADSSQHFSTTVAEVVNV